MIGKINLNKGYTITPWNKILDFGVVMVSSIATISLIRFVTYDVISLPYGIGAFLFLYIAFMVRFKGRKRSIKYFASNHVVLVLLLLFVWEMMQGVLLSGNIGQPVTVVFFICSGFISVLYLNNLVHETGSIDYILKLFCIYAYYNVAVILFSALLMISGVLSPTSNPMEVNELIKDNVENNGASYYIPGFLSVVSTSTNLESSFRLSSLFGLPVFEGLSHEAHTLSYAIVPGLLLSLYVYRNKKNIIYWVFASFLVLIIFSTSMTAIACITCVFFIHMLWMVFRGNNALNGILFFFFLFIFFVAISGSELFSTFMDFVALRSDVDDGSSKASQNALSYIYQPTQLLGSGIFAGFFAQPNQQVGYISSFLIVFFYLIFVISAIKNIMSKDVQCHTIGLAVMYYVLHSMKTGVTMFVYPMLIFFVFLLAYSERRRRLVHA